MCLGVLVQLEDADDCIQEMMRFINQHLACLSHDLKPSQSTVSALVCLEALMEAPENAKITSFLQSQFGLILLAMERPAFHRHAVVASTRALQHYKDAIPEACKDQNSCLEPSLKAAVLFRVFCFGYPYVNL